jgi:hypothetical protein
MVEHMRRAFLTIIFIAVSLDAHSQGSPVHANVMEPATEVKGQEEALRQAELEYDIHAADALLFEDFILTAASDGSLRTKPEFVRMIGDKSDPLEILEYGAMQIRVYGDTAVVLSNVHEKAYYGGEACRIPRSPNRRLGAAKPALGVRNHPRFLVSAKIVRLR